MAIALAVCIGGDSNEGFVAAPLEAAIRSAVEVSLPASEIADVVGAPEGVLIRYEIESTGTPMETDGVIYVDFRVRKAPDLANVFGPNLEADIGDLVLERLDGLALTERATSTDHGSQDQRVLLHLRVADAVPWSVSSSDLAERAGITPARVLGWSKGCNSWPW